LGRFNAGGSSGGGFVSNVRLGAEQSIEQGLNERDFLLGGGQLIIARDQFQCDAANPLHLFKITDVEIIIADGGLVATLMQLGVFGMDADPPLIDVQRFYGLTLPILPLNDTTMKVPIATNVIVQGDTFITPWYTANGNVKARGANIAGAENSLIAHTVNDPWEIVDNKTWVSTTFGTFLKVYFRRIVDAP